MPPFFIFLLKANIILLLLYLFYRLFLRPLTFYKANRVYLVFSIIFSLLFPLLNISGLIKTSQPQTFSQRIIYYVPDITSINQPSRPLFDYWQLAIIIFSCGAIFMLGRLIVQLISLYKVRRQSRLIIINDISVFDPGRHLEPFSFFNNIYINPSLYNNNELQIIIKHELVHTSGKHSFDIMLSEFCRLFCWFNPASWLLNRAIKDNLEFLTDQQLLSAGIEAEYYQYSLLKHTGIPAALGIANNFHFSSLKSRIIMMNKNNSSKYHLTKFLLIMPLIAILLVVFNSSDAKNVKDIISINIPQKITTPLITSNTPLTKTTKNIVADTVPQSKKPTVKKTTTFKNATGHISPVITIDSTRPLYVINGQLINHGQLKKIKPNDIASISVIKGENAITLYGTQAKHGVVNLTLKPGGSATILNPSGITIKPQPLYVIDGAEQDDASALNNIPPNSIKSINVLKGKPATKAYGAKGKNGVIEIRTKQN